jgi:two-component system, response regulator FlrC
VSAEVLLVDDDHAVRQSLGRALRSEGYAVIEAVNGQDALAKLAESTVDLVLLDLNMPVVNGWDTLDQIKEINPFLPVIVITARPNQHHAAARAGVAAVLEKPLALPVLLDLMGRTVAETVEARRRRLANQETLHVAPAAGAQVNLLVG